MKGGIKHTDTCHGKLKELRYSHRNNWWELKQTSSKAVSAL